MCCGAGRVSKKTKELYKSKPGTNQVRVSRKVVVNSVVFEPGRTYYVDASIAEKLKGSIE